MRRLYLALFLFAACRCATSDVNSDSLKVAQNRSVLIQSKAGYCSGTIIRTGLILTAGHCNGDALTVNNIPATVVLSSDKPDLLLLKVETPEYADVRMADAVLAESVFAIASHAPWVDLFNEGRVARVDEHFIASSVMAAPGFSGSALWSVNGAFLGVVVSMSSTTWGDGLEMPMYSWAVSVKDVREFLKKAKV